MTAAVYEEEEETNATKNITYFARGNKFGIVESS